jgi:hypothetical protein
MLTAVVVCVLAHRALRTREKRKRDFSPSPPPLIMRTMIQPLHRTGCSVLKKRTSAVNGPSCACSEHTRNERSESSEKSRKKKASPFFLFFRTAPPWSVLEAIAHSPCYHTRGRCCCTAPRLPVKPQRVTQCSMKSDYSTFGCISRRRNYNTARWCCWWWRNVLYKRGAHTTRSCHTQPHLCYHVPVRKRTPQWWFSLRCTHAKAVPKQRRRSATHTITVTHARLLQTDASTITRFAHRRVPSVLGQCFCGFQTPWVQFPYICNRNPQAFILPPRENRPPDGRV